MLKKSLLILLTAVLTQSARADLWSDLAAYEYGGESNAGENLEKLVNNTPPAEYAGLEEKLIQVISSDAGTEAGKHFACRMLQRVGTAKSVPALAKLLHHDVLSHYARLPLERMTAIPAAGDALRDALGKATAKLVPGLTGSIAARGDKKSAAAIGKWISHADQQAAGAAMAALGHLSGRDSLSLLQSAEPPAALEGAREAALIQCAAGLGGAEGAKVLESIYTTSKSDVHKVAALSELVKADVAKASGLIVGLIKGEPSYLRQGALRQVVSGPGAPLTAAIIHALKDLNPANRAAVITLLGKRGDASALKGLMGHLSSDDQGTREAALKAVARLGGPAEVKPLLERAKTGDANKVYEALAVMAAVGVNDAIAKLLHDDTLRLEAITALAKRGARNAGPELVKLASHQSPAVRTVAWSSMSQLASDKVIGDLMDTLVGIKDSKERGIAQLAVKNICSEAADRNACFDTIAAYYDKSSEETKLFVLDLAANIGTTKALELERKALHSGNEVMAKKALRALANWPNTDSADDLYKVAQNGENETSKILALRGFIQVAGKGGSDKDKLALLESASSLVKRPDEKKLLVSAIRNVKNGKALKMLAGYLEDAEVKNEAEIAAADLAWDLRKRSSKDAIALCEKLATSSNKRVANKAKACLKEMGGKK